MRRWLGVAVGMLGVAALVVAAESWGTAGRSPGPGESKPEVRRFHFDYEVEIAAREAGELQVFLPIAGDTSGQRILATEVDSPIEGHFETESRYGNRYWRVVVPDDRLEPLTIRVRYDVERWRLRAGDDRGEARAAKRYLSANERVVIGHPVLDPILSEIREVEPSGDPAARARAIYDWVVDNVEYKKVGSGWGNGDTFWACSERYGNCTDFHSLFISLARTEGIPARFEMGFPVPLTRSEGQIAGYHCWVEFWLPEIGWIPIDASEASKHPEQRELFYGSHPADRIHITTGRDLRLGEHHRDRPLNYFVYPYVEIDGQRADGIVATRFRYRDRIGEAAGG